jgi:hypothetical protein
MYATGTAPDDGAALCRVDVARPHLYLAATKPRRTSGVTAGLRMSCLKTIAKSASTSARRAMPWHPEFGSETTACAQATGTASGIGDCPGAGPSPRLEEKILPRRSRQWRLAICQRRLAALARPGAPMSLGQLTPIHPAPEQPGSTEVKKKK